jgi:hypothetical protein
MTLKWGNALRIVQDKMHCETITIGISQLGWNGFATNTALQKIGCHSKLCYLF